MLDQNYLDLILVSIAFLFIGITFAHLGVPDGRDGWRDVWYTTDRKDKTIIVGIKEYKNDRFIPLANLIISIGDKPYPEYFTSSDYHHIPAGLNIPLPLLGHNLIVKLSSDSKSNKRLFTELKEIINESEINTSIEEWELVKPLELLKSFVNESDDPEISYSSKMLRDIKHNHFKELLTGL